LRLRSGLLAYVAASKFGDHLPLNFPRSTLCDWVDQTAGLLEPIADEIRRQVLDHVSWSAWTDTYVGDHETCLVGMRSGAVRWRHPAGHYALAFGARTSHTSRGMVVCPS
jgi:hypothetical protein